MVKTIAVTEYADFIRYETLKDGGIFMVLIEVIVMNVLKNILCCVITVKSAGIMGLSQLDFEDLRGYAIMIKVLFICHGNICTTVNK